MALKIYTIDTGVKKLELTKSEIYNIIEYYQKNINKIEHLNRGWWNSEEQMNLFYKYYNENRTKKSVFVQISLELNLKWKSVESTYLKYRKYHEK